MRWAASPTHPWQVTYGDVTTANADAHACGQTYLDLYAIEPEPLRVTQIEASIRDLKDRGDDTAWWWVDALQMAMPIFARLGVPRSDASYFDAMWDLYSHSRDVEEAAYSTLRSVCGGVTLTSRRGARTRLGPTGRTSFGLAVMVGSSPPWRECWKCFRRMQCTAGTTRRISAPSPPV